LQLIELDCCYQNYFIQLTEERKDNSNTQASAAAAQKARRNEWRSPWCRWAQTDQLYSGVVCRRRRRRYDKINQ